MGEPVATAPDAHPSMGGADGDPHLRWLTAHLAGPDLAGATQVALDAAWSARRDAVDGAARTLAEAPPGLGPEGAVLRPPAAVELERLARQLGLVGATYQSGWWSLPRRAPRALTAAILLVLAEADRAVAGGSLVVTDAVCRTLERHDTALAARWIPHLLGLAAPAMTGAILLTEQASGADLGLIETVAQPGVEGSFHLFGEKPYTANAGADLSLVLARPQGAGPGTRGLALFAVPRLLDDGTPNRIAVTALRDQRGLAGLPLGVVRLDGALGTPVGRPGRGFRQAMDIVTVTRILLGVVAAGVVRQAVGRALSRAEGLAGGRRVAAQPLYREELADLVVDQVAATTAALVGADVLQRTDHGRLGNDGTLRLLAPLLKRWLSALGLGVAARGAALAGGEGTFPADIDLLADAVALGAWEGSPNVLALEVVRAADQGHATALFADLERRLEHAGGAAPLGAHVLRELAQQRADLEELALLDEPAQQVRAAPIADHLGALTTLALLVEQAGAHAAATGDGRLLWVAARYAARLGGAAAVGAVVRDGAWQSHADALLTGASPVPLEVGAGAARAVAAAWG